jgi:hypothetical protein
LRFCSCGYNRGNFREPLRAILRTVFKEGCNAFGKQRLRNTAEK